MRKLRHNALMYLSERYTAGKKGRAEDVSIPMSQKKTATQKELFPDLLMEK